MKFRVDFIENEIEVSNKYIRCVEIENKRYYYRLIEVLNNYSNDVDKDNIVLQETNLKFNIKLFLDYFNLEYNSKKIISVINRHIKEQIDTEEKIEINKSYQKLHKLFNNLLKKNNLPIKIQEDVDMDGILKLMNLQINCYNNLLDNLLLFIDINNEIKEFDCLIFVNLKSCLKEDEIKELYKYAIYNEVTIMVVDSTQYRTTCAFEKKLIISENMEEYMV